MEGRAAEELVEDAGGGWIVRDPGSEGGLDPAVGVVEVARERGYRRDPQRRVVSEWAEHPGRVGPERAVALAAGLSAS